jgi:hypothetical protein
LEGKEIVITTNLAQYLPECTQLTHQLFFCLDEAKYAQLVSLFEDNGIWHRQGEVLTGHEQILQAMAKRPSTQRIRHIITNCFIESQLHGVANLVAYMVAYRFDDGTIRSGPVEISRPLRLSLVRAAMRQTGDTWKIVELSLTPEFEFVSEATVPGAGK